ncbi:sterol O-acyltransferase 1-like isoform X3 [Ptychodera flava]|uniref:sterol O-acyltransferase 1-like isoform X3 n=1 Tax=Ptychodera flava TaxID=63121 RepID=UPI003969DF23
MRVCTRSTDMEPKKSWNSLKDFTGVLSQPDPAVRITSTHVQQIRDKAQSLKAEFIEQLDSQLGDVFANFIDEVDGTRSGRSTPIEEPKHRKKNREQQVKTFVARRSVLTELLEVSHIKTIQHVFIAVLIIFSLNTIVYDIVDTGRLQLNFETITWAFGKFPVVMWVWCLMLISTMLLVFPFFTFWAQHRHFQSRLPDAFWLLLYTAYQVAFIVLPVKALLMYELPPASTICVVTEQVRFIMKAHSFVRENIPRALSYKPHSDTDLNVEEDTDMDEIGSTSSNSDSSGASALFDESSPCPGFSQYLYFLFAPTLVYRDHYPRTPSIKWNYVFSNFMQVVGCLFYIYYIFERFCMPVFQNFGKEELTIRNLTLSVFGCMLPATLVLIISFFAILHSWLNAFAEMLRFADRMFYRDWWNSSSFSNYYRTWNVVVHDWLYTYVYRDCLRGLGYSRRALAMLSTFLFSAVAHEYILIIAFRFFYPVLFLMFAGIGFSFIFITDKGVARGWNVFMWVSLFIGNGLLMCLYSQEWYARINCPQESSDLMDMFTPRSWTCKYKPVSSSS